MADKKEISILLLGIVAILAIVGLVLLFNSVGATGQAWASQPGQIWAPPPLPPTLDAPAAVGQVPSAGGAWGGYAYSLGKQAGNVIFVPELEAGNLPMCPNGQLRSKEQGNIIYDPVNDRYCSWFFCAALQGSSDARAQPVMACVQR